MKPTQELRDHLKHLSSLLSKIHKSLFEHQLREFEREAGPVVNSGEKLNLLLQHPDFQWLRELSQFMAFTDEIIFQKEPIALDQVDSVHKEIEELFVTQVKTGFSNAYLEAFKTLPDVAGFHTALLEAVNYRQ